MKKYIYIIIIFIFIVSGCFLSSPAYNTVINFHGLDFSTLMVNDEIDISLSRVNPVNGQISDSFYYFHVYDEPEYLNIKDMGPETFNFIDRISPSFPWDSFAFVHTNHLYVVKCRDGFAKFKVISVYGSNLYDTEVQIFYEFTSDSTF